MLNVYLKNLGTVNKNLVILKTEKGEVNLYFSYETLIAVNGTVSINEWSRTTGKLLNELETDKKLRVPHSEVLKEAEKRINEILGVV